MDAEEPFGEGAAAIPFHAFVASFGYSDDAIPDGERKQQLWHRSCGYLLHIPLPQRSTSGPVPAPRRCTTHF